MSTNKPVAGKIIVECITPILRVSKLAASIRFYVDVLGFKVNWGGESESSFASVSRDANQSCCRRVSKDTRALGSGSEWTT